MAVFFEQTFLFVLYSLCLQHGSFLFGNVYDYILVVLVLFLFYFIFFFFFFIFFLLFFFFFFFLSFLFKTLLGLILLLLFGERHLKFDQVDIGLLDDLNDHEEMDNTL